MKLINPELKYLDQLVRQKIIEPQEYFNRLELAYRTNPTSFTEEEVDYIERQFKKVDLKFNRDLEAADANLLSTMNQFTSGLVEGFTTLGWSEEPDTTAESIANKLGHLIGFAPDVVASFFSMGQYIPIAAAKRAAIGGSAVTRGALQAAGSKAPGFLRKKVGPKTFTLQSVPMKVADYVVEQSKNFLGGAGVTAGGYLSKGIFASPKLRNIGEQGIHLGVALGVSAWKDGPKGMIDSAMHGAAAGALFGTIGNYVNVGRLLENPKTRKLGQDTIRQVATEVSKDAAKTEGLNMIVRGTLGSIAQGGMATAQGLPVAEQVYEYMLGAFFGATTKSAGFAARTKFIMKNDYKNYRLGMTEQEAIDVARKDPEFQALSKNDQAYVETYIAKVVAQKFNMHAPLMGDLQKIPEIAKAVEKLGFDINQLTQPQFEQVFKQVKQDRAVQDLEGPTDIDIRVQERPAEYENVKPDATDTIKNQVLQNKIDIAYNEMLEISANADLNEPKIAIKNRDLELIANDIRGFKIGRNLDEINVTIAKLAKDNNYELNPTKAAILKEYEKLGLPNTFFTDVGVNNQRLGSYLKLKKNFTRRVDYEIDLTGDVVEIREIPERDFKGEVLGGDRPQSKWNKTFAGDPVEARLLIRKSYFEKFTKARLGRQGEIQEIPVYDRTNGGPLDFKNAGRKQVHDNAFNIKEQFTKEVQNRLIKSLDEKGMYIYGGTKDNGNLVVHRYAFTKTIRDNNRQEFFTRLENEVKGLKFKVKDDATLSNIFYTLIESGLYDPRNGFSIDLMVAATKKYINNPLYANVQKFNKYANLSQGADIPLEAAEYVNTTSTEAKNNPANNREAGKFNMIMVKDFQDPMFNNSESGTDAAVIARHEVFDAIQTRNFRPSNNGFLKLVGYKGPEYGENPIGNILLKTGTFRATEAQQKFMFENGIDFIVPKTAAKTSLGLREHTIEFVKATESWTLVDSTLQPFKMRPDELYLNMGVYENFKGNKPAPFQKQILDKINEQQLGPDLAKGVKDDYSKLVEDSYNGDPNRTAEFDQIAQQSLQDRRYKLPETYDFNVNDISIESINNVLSRDITSPLSRKVIDKILNRGREDYRELITESTDEVAQRLMGLEVYEIPDILTRLDYDPGILLQPNIKKFVDKSLARYRTSRVVSPQIKHSTTGKLGPRDSETFARHPELNDNTFMMGRNFAKEYEIALPDNLGGVQSLESAFGKYKESLSPTQTQYDKADKEALAAAMQFMLVRSPNSSNGGVRVLDFAGFVDRKGFGIYTTSKNDYYLGGADKDADSVSVYSGMSKNIREAFKKYDNEFLQDGVLYNFEKPTQIFKDLISEAQDKGPAGNFADLVDVNSRIEVARMARRGKQQMGIIVDAMTRMQNLADVIVKRNGVFETSYVYNEKPSDGKIQIRLNDTLPGKAGKVTLEQIAKQLQLDSVNIVNLMADSANFSKVEFYNKIVNKVWETYFKVTGDVMEVNNKTIYTPSLKGNNYFATTENAYGLYLTEKVHKDMYKVSGNSVLKINEYSRIAQEYMNEMGTDIPFYSNIAEAVMRTPDFFINPYKFYYNEAALKNQAESGRSELDVARLYVQKLRELVKGDKLFKRFGLKDFWNTHIETEINLKEIMNSSPYLMHEKLMDYQGIFSSLQRSRDFIREAANTGVGTETAEKIVADIVDTTYRIKSFFYTETQLYGIGNMEKEIKITPKEINGIIVRLKDKYRNQYKNRDDLVNEIETLIDYWLLTRDFRSAQTDILKHQEKDFVEVDAKIRKEIKRLTENNLLNDLESSGIHDYLKEKGKSFKKLRPTLDYAYRSLAIKNSNREEFFKSQSKYLKEITENITEQLKLPEESISLKKYLEEEIPFDIEPSFDYDTGVKNNLTEVKDNKLKKKEKRVEEEVMDYDVEVDDDGTFYKVPIETGPVKKPIKDTPETVDQLKKTNEMLDEILPQFDWLKKKAKPNELLTDEAQVEVDRLRDIMRKTPSTIARFEEFWIGLTFRLEGVGRRLDTLNTSDLRMLNNALEERFSAKSIVDKTTGKLIKKPGWLEQMLNYKVIGKKLETFEEIEYIKAAVPVIDKFGQQKPKTMNIILPTSTLELGRKTIDKFDTLQKLMASGIEAQHNGFYNFLNIDNANLIKHRDLLIEHAWNINEYQQGKYPSNETSATAKERIKDAFIDSTDTVAKLTGLKFPWPAKDGGKSEMIDAQTYSERLAQRFAQDLKSINNSYIKSNWESIEKFFKQQKVKMNLYKSKQPLNAFEGYTKDQLENMTMSEQQTALQNKNIALNKMESMFLDVHGLIRPELVNLMFKKFDLQAAPDRTIFGEFFSINDYFFIKYHMQIRDRLEFSYPEINLDKPLNIKERGIVTKFIKKEMDKASYREHIVGDVYRGYMPRMGHFDIAANIPKIQAFAEKQIKQRIEEVKQPGGFQQLPLDLRMAVEYNELSKSEAINIFKDTLMARFRREMDNSASNGGYESEAQVRDLFTRSNYKGYVGDYTASMLRNRGQEFLPYYSKNIDVMKRYKQQLIKAHLTNLAGFRAELLLRRFDKVNGKEGFVENWSRYMRDAFTNMLGMSNYRALNIHGIEKKDQGLYKRYIDNNLSREGLRLSVAEKDKLLDFDIAIRVSGAEKQNILFKSQNDVKQATKEVNNLRMTRAKKLSQEVNVTGKYNSLYHLTSDESAVKLFDGINKLFGGRLFGSLPEVKNVKGKVIGEAERRNAVLNRIRGISDLEGRFELLSLLSHPKTAITNMYGGTVNTIADTGWSAFRKANSNNYLLSMMQGMNAKFEFFNESTGKKQERGFESRADIDTWLESLGVYDQMFLDMVALDRNFGKKGVRKFWQEFIKRVNKSTRENDVQTKATYEQLQRKTLKEVARDLKVEVPIVEFGALPMKWSERKLRGTAFLANYINMRDSVLEPIKDQIPFDSPVLINYALKGVEASQFMYQATFRPNFANTSLGRVLTRFQPYAWNSIGRRMRLFKEARQAEWNTEVLASKKAQRQFTFDLMSLALANIFVSTIFEYALSPPMNWLQDTAALLFGDKKARDRAFFSSYPHPVLAPLQVVTPPIGRFVMQPITAILNQDFDQFKDYTLYSYFPFGRLVRDGLRTYSSPAMAVDFMTGLPLHAVHEMRQEQKEKASRDEPLDPDFSIFDED